MSFFDDVYKVVSSVPRGFVTTYGAVAAACGNPRMARQVGYALHVNPRPDEIPCYRVVFKDGCLSKAFAFGGINAQRALLEADGVKFIGDKVDMSIGVYLPKGI